MASRTPGTPTALIVSPRGQITLPKPVRARLRHRRRLGSAAGRRPGGSSWRIPRVFAVTGQSRSLYADEEIERLVGADRANPGERAALRRRWSLKPGAQRRRGRG